MLFTTVRSCLFIGNLVVMSLCTYAQNNSKIPTIPGVNPLNLGDKFPDLVFDTVLNYEKSAIKISDFKGKLLILDFWNINCSPCISNFPKYELLQNKYLNDIMILPIGYQLKKNEILDFYLKRKGTNKEIKLPSVVYQIHLGVPNMLNSLFPNRGGFPFLVWIDKNGVFIGGTDGNALSEINIGKILGGQYHSLGNRQTPRIKAEESFLLTQQTNETVQVFGSAFAGYIERLVQPDNGMGSIYNINQTKVIRLMNQSIEKLYLIAYKNVYDKSEFARFLYSPSYLQKLIVINGEVKYDFGKKRREVQMMNQWEHNLFRKENQFCYEQIQPETTTNDYMYTQMIDDLDRFFSIKTELRIMNFPCYLLDTLPGFSRIRSKQSNAKSTYDEISDTTLYRGFNISQIVHIINASAIDLFVIDNTKIDYKIDFIRPPMPTIEHLKKFLKDHHLCLTRTEQQMEVLSIKNR